LCALIEGWRPAQGDATGADSPGPDDATALPRTANLYAFKRP
jgi:hypothetical protein